MSPNRAGCSGRGCCSPPERRKNFFGFCHPICSGKLHEDNDKSGRIEQKTGSIFISTNISTPDSNSDDLAMSHSSGTTSCVKIKTSAPDSVNTLSTPSATVNVDQKTVREAPIIEIDIENGLVESHHIILSVQGMDCTTCETTLHRVLESLPGVQHVQVSLLLSQAEFDLKESVNLHCGNVAGIINQRTNFKCSRVSFGGAALDLVVIGCHQDYLDGYPDGIEKVTRVDDKTIRVYYNPSIIGARSILSHPFFHSAKLAPLSASLNTSTTRAQLYKTAYLTIISALLTSPVLIMAYAPLPKNGLVYGAVSLILATTVQFGVGGFIYVSALKALIYSRLVGMDMLVVLSTTIAYVYSVIAFAYLCEGRPLNPEGFFETSTLLVTLIMVGKTASGLARQKALDTISVESLQTPTARIANFPTQEDAFLDARLLEYDDILTILPDTSIVTDGLVISGDSEVDESLITGEAAPVPKSSGMPVIAGSLNRSGILKVQVTRLIHENTIKVVGSMVNEAKKSKPKIQEIADLVAGRFVPAIFIITLLVFGIWIGVELQRHDATIGDAATSAMTYAVSVLIVSCPCAIGLAVPMVIVIASGVGARRGLILKSPEAIEIARKITHVVFDKTGTLTQGKLSVVAEEIMEGMSMKIDSVILAITSSSKHPISVTIASHLSESGVQPLQLQDLVSVPGEGIEAKLDETCIQAGNPYWLGVEKTKAVCAVLAAGLSVFCVTIDGELVATFGLQDILRPDAIQTIDSLKRRSITVSMISGDNTAAVEAVATQLSIPIHCTRARCNPADKQAYIKGLNASTKNIVLFCGDGTNDAVALAQASIGVHMNEGTDVARSAADVILTRPSLMRIITLIDLSKASYRRIVLNFVWCFVYNTLAVLISAGAFEGVHPHFRIPPQYAGVGEIISVLPVIFLAVTLRWSRL